jgi:hypothetical protein
MYVHTHVWMSTATNVIMYKSIWTCQACQSGHYVADHANLIYYSSLDTLTIVCLTTKFEPFVFPVLGFVFVCVSDIYIVVSLYDFRLLPTHFRYVIIEVIRMTFMMKSRVD